MASSPRTVPADESFDSIEEFLQYLWLALLACVLTTSLAPVVEKLLAELDDHRNNRRKLARALAALKAKEIWADDELNLILDDVKAVLSADKSPSGVELYNDVFEGKSPSETRKFILGEQLTKMTLWPGKLAGSSRPEVQKLGLVTAQSTKNAVDLLNEGGQAATALDQFDLVTRAAFVDSVNGAVKIIFGQLSDMEHNPPPTAKGPMPPGFVDRFFLRESGPRAATVKELEKSLKKAQDKVKQIEENLQEAKDEQAQKLQAKQDKEVKEKMAQVAAAQKIIDDAAAEVAKLQAEIAKIKPPEE